MQGSWQGRGEEGCKNSWEYSREEPALLQGHEPARQRGQEVRSAVDRGQAVQGLGAVGRLWDFFWSVMGSIGGFGLKVDRSLFPFHIIQVCVDIR